MGKSIDYLKGVFKDTKKKCISYQGTCHDCGKETEVVIWDEKDGIVTDGGGFWYEPSNNKQNIFIKCEDCFQKDKVLRNFQETEVWSRVVGYLRPVRHWNKGKQAEFAERVNYKVTE